jgi:hypothetical protein
MYLFERFAGERGGEHRLQHLDEHRLQHLDEARLHLLCRDEDEQRSHVQFQQSLIGNNVRLEWKTANRLFKFKNVNSSSISK